MKENNFNNLVAVLAVVVVLIALINLSVTLIKVSNLKEKITGYSVDYGFVNITINTAISLNVSRDTINFGAGVIDAGSDNVTMWTNGDDNFTVVGGNWSGVPNNDGKLSGMIIENVGNVNCSVKLQTGMDADGFIGGTNPLYQWKISNREVGACGDWSETTTSAQDNWADVNNSQVTFCEKLEYQNILADEMFIDIKLLVPENSPNMTGLILGDTIIVTGDAAIS